MSAVTAVIEKKMKAVDEGVLKACAEIALNCKYFVTSFSYRYLYTNALA